MFSFFAPKHVKQGRQFVKDARKLLAYKRDLWSAGQIADFEKGIGQLEAAAKAGEKAPIEAVAQELDKQCSVNLPPVHDAGWRENCEVFLVAIVVALGVRTYFLQPFTIPTGSMQPTLYGIRAFPTPDEPPNVVTQVFQAGVLGRGWLNVTAKDDEVVSKEVEEITRFGFFTYSRVTTSRVVNTDEGPRPSASGGNTYLLRISPSTLAQGFGVGKGRFFKRGEPIARGYVDTGDHVFVDKISYHFRTPRRGDVFVFNTQKLPTIERRIETESRTDRNDPTEFDLPDAAVFADQMTGRYGMRIKVDMSRPSQFYIKRLVGLPGDEMRIDSPQLFVNAKLAEGRCFERVMAMKDGYDGYSQGASNFLMPVLRTPQDRYTIPHHHYWAMGDNSYHSSDSRDWGPVPERNIMGRGVFVYWPFASHWGLIK